MLHNKQSGPGEVSGGGGFDCGSNQLSAPPKPTSLVTFLFGDKKVTRPYRKHNQFADTRIEEQLYNRKEGYHFEDH